MLGMSATGDMSAVVTFVVTCHDMSQCHHRNDFLTLTCHKDIQQHADMSYDMSGRHEIPSLRQHVVSRHSQHSCDLFCVTELEYSQYHVLREQLFLFYAALFMQQSCFE